MHAPRRATRDVGDRARAQPRFSHGGARAGLRYRIGRHRLGASVIHDGYDIPSITGSITSPPSNIRGSGGHTIVTGSIEVAL